MVKEILYILFSLYCMCTLLTMFSAFYVIYGLQSNGNIREKVFVFIDNDWESSRPKWMITASVFIPVLQLFIAYYLLFLIFASRDSVQAMVDKTNAERELEEKYDYYDGECSEGEVREDSDSNV